jgi:hypothetical protein
VTSGASPRGSGTGGRGGDGLLAGLEAVYAELDARLESLGARCTSCGECCAFGPGSPVLYATELERRLLTREPPRAEVAPGPRACPYLDGATRQCTARTRRTIGCRTFFCEKALPSDAARERAMDLCERALGRVREISSEAGIEWDYAPVVPLLGPRR